MKDLKPIPKFKSEKEERKFWLTHDSTDYVDWSKARKMKVFLAEKVKKELAV